MQEPTKPKGKPRGAPANVIARNERLNMLEPKVLRFWERTLDEKSDATISERIQVSKLIVEYAWGKPKQQVQVDARVEVNHTAHLQALNNLIQAASGPIIDAKPLNQLDYLDAGPNQSDISNQPTVADPVTITPAALDPGPPVPSGPPRGDLDMDHPRPLDTENDG